MPVFPSDNIFQKISIKEDSIVEIYNESSIDKWQMTNQENKKYLHESIIITRLKTKKIPTTARNYMTRRIIIYDNNGIKKIIHFFSYIKRIAQFKIFKRSKFFIWIIILQIFLAFFKVEKNNENELCYKTIII